MEGVLPEVVSKSNGHRAVEYANIVVELVEATRELKSQNEDLQERIDVLGCRDCGNTGYMGAKLVHSYRALRERIYQEKYFMLMFLLRINDLRVRCNPRADT